MEGGIIMIKNQEYDNYFSIATWGKSGGLCDVKVKENVKKKES